MNNNKYSKKVTWSVEVVVDNVCLVYTQSSFGGFLPWSKLSTAKMKMNFCLCM